MRNAAGTRNTRRKNLRDCTSKLKRKQLIKCSKNGSNSHCLSKEMRRSKSVSEINRRKMTKRERRKRKPTTALWLASLTKSGRRRSRRRTG